METRFHLGKEITTDKAFRLKSQTCQPPFGGARRLRWQLRRPLFYHALGAVLARINMDADPGAFIRRGVFKLQGNASVPGLSGLIFPG